MESFRSPLYRSSKAGTKEQEKQTGYGTGTLDDHFRVIRSKKAFSPHPATNAIRSNIPTNPVKGASATSTAASKLESKPSMDIDASAEAFINKFKKQLIIQRLESIENYEQMLARGT